MFSSSSTYSNLKSQFLFSVQLTQFTHIGIEAAKGCKQVFEFCSADGAECWQRKFICDSSFAMRYNAAQPRHTCTNDTSNYLDIALALNT